MDECSHCGKQVAIGLVCVEEYNMLESNRPTLYLCPDCFVICPHCSEPVHAGQMNYEIDMCWFCCQRTPPIT